MAEVAIVKSKQRSRANRSPKKTMAATEFQEMLARRRPIAIGNQCDKRLSAAAMMFQTRLAALDLERYVRARQARTHSRSAALLTDVVRPTLLHIAKIIGHGDERRFSRVFDDDQTGDILLNVELLNRHFHSLQKACGPVAEAAIGSVWRTATSLAPGAPHRSLAGAQTYKRLFQECIEPAFASVVRDRWSEVVQNNLELEAIYSRRASLQNFVADILHMRIGNWLNNRKPPFKKTPSVLLRNLTRLAKVFSGNLYGNQAPACASINHEVDLVLEIVHRSLDRRSQSGTRRRVESMRHEYAKAPWEGGHHCALCSGLTELTVMRMRPTKAVFEAAYSKLSPSANFCALHAPRTARRRGGNDPIKKRFAEIRELIYDERKRDIRYFSRFIHPDEGPTFPQEWQLLWEAMEVRMKYADTPRLFVFESNVLEVASLFAKEGPDNDALEIDRLVQSGMGQSQIARQLRKTAKYIGARNQVAIARLRHQGLTWPQIAKRLGVSRRAVYKRKNSIWGCFDFSPSRSKELVWWPYDDLPDAPEIIRFGKRADRKWHTAEEYTRQMLRRSRVNNADGDAHEFTHDGEQFAATRLHLADGGTLLHITKKINLEGFIRMVERNVTASSLTQAQASTA